MKNVFYGPSKTKRRTMRVRLEHFDTYYEPDTCRLMLQEVRTWYNEKYWPLRESTYSNRKIEQKALRVRKTVENIIHYHYRKHSGYYLDKKYVEDPAGFFEYLLKNWDERMPLRKDKCQGFKAKNFNLLT